MTTAITVLDRSEVVAAALSPLRGQMLELLVEPQSASSLARALDLPRQKVNYHLRELERHGLVGLVEERQRRGLTERFYRISGGHLLVDPELLSPVASPSFDEHAADRLAATAARAVHDVGALMREAAAAGERLATFTVESEMTFAAPGDLRAFVAELTELIAKYDRPAAAGGRRHRFVAMSHPSRQETANG